MIDDNDVGVICLYLLQYDYDCRGTKCYDGYRRVCSVYLYSRRNHYRYNNNNIITDMSAFSRAA